MFVISDLLFLQEEIRKVLTKGKAAGVLRLVFHDAGTYETNENSGIIIINKIIFFK